MFWGLLSIRWEKQNSHNLTILQAVCVCVWDIVLIACVLCFYLWCVWPCLYLCLSRLFLCVCIFFKNAFVRVCVCVCMWSRLRICVSVLACVCLCVPRVFLCGCSCLIAMVSLRKRLRNCAAWWLISLLHMCACVHVRLAFFLSLPDMTASENPASCCPLWRERED